MDVESIERTLYGNLVLLDLFGIRARHAMSTFELKIECKTWHLQLDVIATSFLALLDQAGEDGRSLQGR
jgi:hypothetical protein